MRPTDYECPRLPTLHKIAIDPAGDPKCVSCRDEHGVLKQSAADVARREPAVETTIIDMGPGDLNQDSILRDGESFYSTVNDPESVATTPYVWAAPPRCQLHPQAYTWKSETGIRCAICSTLLDGTQRPPEPPLTRNLDTFQTEAARVTGGWQEGLQLDPAMARLLKAACTISSEAGEVMNEVNRIVFGGWPLDDEIRRKLILELGDVQWGLAEAASALDVELSRVATENTRKLERRYPQGWSVAASMAGRKPTSG